jgi:uncharacterized membrane protein (DUF441 family)
MSWENLPLLIILVLAVLGNNQAVSVAAAFLLMIKLLGFDTWFPIIESKGLNIGVTILTISILVPVAAGRISLQNMVDACKNPTGLLAIAAGIFAAWAAGRGLFFIKASPDMITSLIIGTIAGVCFLDGIAIGPLIAAGMAYLAASLFHFIK